MCLFDKDLKEIMMQKKFKKTVGVVLLLAMLVVFLNTSFAAEEVDGCKLALYRCMTDPMNLMFSTEGLVYCSIGYIFCKKYIES